MPNTQLLEELRFVNSANNSAAGVTDVTPAARIDMQGFHGVLLLAKIGTIDATGTVTFTARSAATDVAGAKLALIATLADTDDDSWVALDLRDPDERFVDWIIERGVANSEVDAVLAIPYRANSLPITQAAADIAASTTAVRPAKQ